MSSKDSLYVLLMLIHVKIRLWLDILAVKNNTEEIWLCVAAQNQCKRTRGL